MYMKRTALLSWLWAIALSIAAMTSVHAGSEVSSAVVQAGQKAVLKVNVNGAGENMVVFSSMRSTARVTTVSLIDPLGRRVWEKTPEQLGFVPRAQMREKDRGDSIGLPQVRDAVSGIWRIEVTAAAEADAGGVAMFVYEVLPRFGITMHVGAESAYAGEPVLITIRPTDYGVPRPGIGPISVAVRKADGTGFTSQVEAVESARTPEGVVITSEPGTYVAKVRMVEPGSYKFETRTRTVGRNGESSTSVTGAIAVAPRVAEVKLVGLHEQAPEGTGCVQRVFVDVDVRGVDGAQYALNVSLVGKDGRVVRAGKAFEMVGRSSRQSVPFDAKDLPTSEWPTKLLRVALLRTDLNALRVVDEQLDFSVNGAGKAARRACR